MSKLTEKLVALKTKLSSAANDAEKTKIEDQIAETEIAIEEEEKVAKAEALAAKEKAKRILSIMDKHKVKSVYENPNGELFTRHDLAALSVKDKSTIKEHTREVIETKIAE